ncbi:MAG: hypothetical protein F4X08_15775 [Gemmatimonadetes bacterium]|nr:hypothetical protein [Gemmatimonadota bacterium]MYD27259.1 hypothetical protein [Gemmatimonadota bacterium]MYI99038.1 hypothetical protein [Gemmatimonadota bacterium]
MSTINLFQFGKGNIGGALIRQVADRAGSLAETTGLSFEYIGICGRNRLIFNPGGLNKALSGPGGLDRLLEDGDSRKDYPGAAAMIDRLLGGPGGPGDPPVNLCVVDTTSAEMTEVHLACLRRGVPVVTANKKPITDRSAAYEEIRRLGRADRMRYWYETTAGAGLPIVSTVRELVDTGDEVTRIAGCLSGTLGYICSQLDHGRTFSEIVREAKELGYTEPDPRDDLNGMDVARKALILAREIGYRLELDDLEIEGMVSNALLDAPSVDAFMAMLTGEDTAYAQRVESGGDRGQVLRYVATVGEGTCRVGLENVDRESPLGSLAGPDNMVVCTTKRYRDNPLIVRGPGAGPEVTAGGLFGDLIKAARALPGSDHP